MNMSPSILSLIFSYLLIAFFSLIYYPKYKAPQAEATLGWDVSGYYMYLPAAFIYQDLKKVEFRDEIMKAYEPTPDFQQAYPYKNGNWVMKYSMGQAVMYLPFFFLGHSYALVSAYPADGFSLPYQVAISLGSMLMAFLGLWIIRRVLLRFFKEGAVAGALVIVVFGSNYLDYSSMNAAMTHNYLFTVYAGLLALTISFYENPSYRKAAGIGALVGIAALTRPTEILSAILPLMWGLYFPLGKFLKERLNFLRSHLPKFLLAAILTGAVGFLQLLYWKWVGGDWLIYSYQDQGFSWLHPHIMDCLFSYRAGWWIYSPLMVLPLLGFPFLAAKNQRVFWPSLAFSFLFMYVTFAWDIWWYGGSLGQRAMVQAYAVLLLPLTALTEWIHSRKILTYIFYILVGLGIYHNLWITHQAHKGGLFVPEQVTERYFKNILWRYEAKLNVKLLLDNSEGFLGEPRDILEIARTDLEADRLSPSPFPPIQGQQSLWVSNDKEFSDNWMIPVSPLEKDYLRLQTQVRCISKEWEWWRVPQVIMELRKGRNVVKSQIIRPHRHMNEGETIEMNVDMRLPSGDYEQVKVYLWNAGSTHPLLVDQLVLLAFDD